MTRAVPVATYKSAQKELRRRAAEVVAARKAGLAKIASRGRRLIDREDACGAYMEARFWLREQRRLVDGIHPEKNCHLSPAAKARHERRHADL